VTGPLLFVANYGLNVTPVTVYDANRKYPKPLATIIENINNARGACVDGDGTLYVTNAPNTGNTGWILEYAIGQTTTLRVVTEGISYPGYCVNYPNAGNPIRTIRELLSHRVRHSFPYVAISVAPSLRRAAKSQKNKE
jgi:hypothetical protein